MKKIFLGLLMFIMLTPSLACAMPVCADEAQAAAIEQPCAGHVSHHESGKDNKTGKVNLLQDCMGVDLQMADSVFAKKPDTQNSINLAALINHDQLPAWPPAKAAGIRGPPPDWSDLSRSRPYILLITQRFRI